jgi:hypothetical protein
MAKTSSAGRITRAMTRLSKTSDIRAAGHSTVLSAERAAQLSRLLPRRRSMRSALGVFYRKVAGLPNVALREPLDVLVAIRLEFRAR